MQKITTTQFKDYKDIVTNILEEIPITRESDTVLYCKVIEKYDNTLLGLSFGSVFPRLSELGYPSFSTISRTRRRVQSERKDLRASKKRQEERAELEGIFYNEFSN